MAEEQRYLVFEVQSTGPGEEDFRFGPSTRGGLEQPSAVLSVESLSPGDAAERRREPGTVVAEPLPMRLIQPLDVQDAAAPAAAGPTWGVEAVGALASPFTGQGIKVAVLDTGIDADHPAFAGAQVTQKDFTGEGDGDTHGHGTHCAGTIAGREVEGLRFGVAPGVSEIFAGKVLGEEGGSSEMIVNGMLWALESGANVISMSLGMDFPGAVERLTSQGIPIQPATSRALEAYRDNLRLFGSVAELIRNSPQLGRVAIVVAATGNESERSAAPAYTIGVAPPAASEGFIPVAALGQDNGGFSVASFSNTGGVLAAPGVDVISAKPGGGFQSMSGTSMATPHVAGVAALWAESLVASSGELDPGQLTANLRGTAKKVPGLTPADGGGGLVQAPTG